MSEDRAQIQRPWKWHDWICATDGRVLVAIPDDGQPAPELGVAAAAVAPMLDVNLPRPRRVPLDLLREWCGPLDARCGSCGQLAPSLVLEALRYTQDRRGKIGDAVFNRRLLGLIVHSAPGSHVEMSEQGQHRAILIHGQGWRALLMPLKSDATEIQDSDGFVIDIADIDDLLAMEAARG